MYAKISKFHEKISTEIYLNHKKELEDKFKFHQ
jgi:hypothetical protein